MAQHTRRVRGSPMTQEHHLTFGPFRLETTPTRLWREEQVIPLRPRTGAVLPAHPLRGMVQELCGRGQAVDLRLEFLSAEEVAAYVAGRLGGPVAAPLAAFISARTNGNALLMVNMVDYLVAQGAVVRHAGEWMLRELEHSLHLCYTTRLSTLLFPHGNESRGRHGFYGTRALWLLGY